MPGGRPGIPGDPRNPALLAARPKGLAKLMAAEEAGMLEAGPELVTAGEVGWPRGEEEDIRGDCRDGDKICGEGDSSLLIGDPS